MKLYIFPEPLQPKAISDTCVLTNPLPAGTVVKNPPAKKETWIQPLGQEDSLEKERATHSSILPWEISWTEQPGGLQTIGVAESQTCLNN